MQVIPILDPEKTPDRVARSKPGILALDCLALDSIDTKVLHSNDYLAALASWLP